MDSTLLAAGLGFIAGLGGPLLQQLLSQKQQKAAWLLDERAAVYSEVMAYAMWIGASLVAYSRDYEEPSYGPELGEEPTDRNSLTARLRLIGSEDAYRAWTSATKAWDDLVWDLNESDEFERYHGEHLPIDHPRSKQVATLVSDVMVLLRREVGNRGE